jgi:UDP-N-acetyl-D-galactosamine dehydrogenase
MTRKRIHVSGGRVLVLGLTFKENCPDVRNSKVVDVVRELERYGAKVDVYDPWIDPAEAKHEYHIVPIKALKDGAYDAVVVAVSHREFKKLGLARIKELCKREHVIYDIKHVFPADAVDGRL